MSGQLTRDTWLWHAEAARGYRGRNAQAPATSALRALLSMTGELERRPRRFICASENFPAAAPGRHLGRTGSRKTNKQNKKTSRNGPFFSLELNTTFVIPDFDKLSCSYISLIERCHALSCQCLVSGRQLGLRYQHCPWSISGHNRHLHLQRHYACERLRRMARRQDDRRRPGHSAPRV